MRFKWDSNVARDIEIDLDRLRDELGDCAVEIDRCTAILSEMEGGDMSNIIANYVSAAGKLKKGMRQLEETFRRTGRGIARANEMFENTEQSLRRRADGMGGEAPEPVWGQGVTGHSVAPMFYNIPGIPGFGPIGFENTAPSVPWPVLREVSRAVAIDQVSVGSGVMMPPWLQSIIDAE